MNPETPQDPSTVSENPVASMPEAAPQPVAPAAPVAVAAPQLDFSAGWPGAFALYKLSASVMRVNAGTILLLFLIDFASGLLRFIPILGAIASIIIGAMVSMAIIKTTFAGIDGQKMSVSQALSNPAVQVLRYIGLTLLTMLIVGVSFLLLIIPGLIVLPRIYLAPYLMVKKDLKIKEALSMSWDITKGHSGKFWGIVGVGLLILLSCIVLIGIYFAFMYAAAAAILCTYILQQTPQAPVVSGAPVTPPTQAAPVA